MDAWPFRDPEKTAVFTTRQVLEDHAPILRVTHDGADGSWQFHAAGAPSAKDACVLAFREVVDLDRSIVALADLPAGWVATRSDPGKPWHCRKNTD